MSIDYIKFNISQGKSNTNGGYKRAVVKRVETNLSNNKDYQYCMGDIIRHALSRAVGNDFDDERFTYTFPFTL